MNFAKNIEIFIANGYCLLNSWIFQETLFYGIITFTCIHYFFKNNSPRHCRRPSGSILGLLMFCNLIIFADLPKSMYNASFHYEQVKRIRNSEFDIDFKVANFRFSNVMPNFFLKNQRKLHVNENRANVYKHKRTVHHYKYITLHSIWAEAQKLDIVRELGGRVHYLKERKQ